MIQSTGKDFGDTFQKCFFQHIWIATKCILKYNYSTLVVKILEKAKNRYIQSNLLQKM